MTRLAAWTGFEIFTRDFELAESDGGRLALRRSVAADSFVGGLASTVDLSTMGGDAAVGFCGVHASQPVADIDYLLARVIAENTALTIRRWSVVFIHIATTRCWLMLCGCSAPSGAVEVLPR
jgi:hypothetical protein